MPDFSWEASLSDVLDEIAEEDDGLIIGDDGYQIPRDGCLTCVVCRALVPVEEINYFRRAGDWTKEFCQACYDVEVENAESL
jgi:hypothetical protein